MAHFHLAPVRNPSTDYWLTFALPLSPIWPYSLIYKICPSESLTSGVAVSDMNFHFWFGWLRVSSSGDHAYSCLRANQDCLSQFSKSSQAAVSGDIAMHSVHCSLTQVWLPVRTLTVPFLSKKAKQNAKFIGRLMSGHLVRAIRETQTVQWPPWRRRRRWRSLTVKLDSGSLSQGKACIWIIVCKRNTPIINMVVQFPDRLLQWYRPLLFVPVKAGPFTRSTLGAWLSVFQCQASFLELTCH